MCFLDNVFNVEVIGVSSETDFYGTWIESTASAHVRQTSGHASWSTTLFAAHGRHWHTHLTHHILHHVLHLWILHHVLGHLSHLRITHHLLHCSTHLAKVGHATGHSRHSGGRLLQLFFHDL